jgi:hypothetical protein
MAWPQRLKLVEMPSQRTKPTSQHEKRIRTHGPAGKRMHGKIDLYSLHKRLARVAAMERTVAAEWAQRHIQIFEMHRLDRPLMKREWAQL